MDCSLLNLHCMLLLFQLYFFSFEINRVISQTTHGNRFDAGLCWWIEYNSTRWNELANYLRCWRKYKDWRNISSFIPGQRTWFTIATSAKLHRWTNGKLFLLSHFIHLMTLNNCLHDKWQIFATFYFSFFRYVVTSLHRFESFIFPYGKIQVLDIYDSSAGMLRIGPFNYDPIRGVDLWLAQSDEFLLTHLSTSPEVEPPHFTNQVHL